MVIFKQFFLIFLAVLYSTSSNAKQLAPGDVINKFSILLASEQITPSKASLPKNYKLIESQFEEVLDINTIAKLVMGKEYYLSASKQERVLFRESFKKSLIQTYIASAALFKGSRVILDNPNEIPKGHIMSLKGVASTGDGSTIPLIFTLKKDKRDIWKIVNISLSGINLGMTFKKQFSRLVSESNQNVSTAINKWANSQNPNQRKVANYSESSIEGWKEIIFDGKTKYIDQNTCILAISENSSSGLIKESRERISAGTTLSWGWMANNLIQSKKYRSEKTKKGDDFLTRVYVIHEGKFPWQTKAINYVWSKNNNISSNWENPFLKNAHMVVVQSGDKNLRKWMYFERNLVDDFKKYHDIEIEKIDAVAIMTDTDNAGGKAEACYSLPQLKEKNIL
jgi:ABC-type transporter MlaC component